MTTMIPVVNGRSASDDDEPNRGGMKVRSLAAAADGGRSIHACHEERLTFPFPSQDPHGMPCLSLVSEQREHRNTRGKIGRSRFGGSGIGC
jgi:hypothetical protein